MSSWITKWALSQTKGLKGFVEDFDINKILTNLMKVWTQSGITDAQKESADYSQGLKESFYNKYESLPAQMAQAQQAGINPFTLFGNGASVTASSAPQTAAAPSTDLLATLLNYKLQSRKLDQDEFLLEGKDRLNRSRADVADAQVGNIKENTKYLTQQIYESDSRRRLNDANISLTEAKTALTWREEAVAQIQGEHAEEYWSNYNRLLELQGDYQDALISRNTFEILKIRQEIKTSSALCDKYVKEGLNLAIENNILKSEDIIQAAHAKNVDFEIKSGNVGAVVDIAANAIGSVVGAVTGVGKMKAGLSMARSAASRAKSFALSVAKGRR